MTYDIPANSQIFGQMIKAAGICGIVYSSKMTRQDCLAIFPENFKNTTSYVELADDPPDSRTPRRIDSSNFGHCEKQLSELY